MKTLCLNCKHLEVRGDLVNQGSDYKSPDKLPVNPVMPVQANKWCGIKNICLNNSAPHNSCNTFKDR